MSDPGVGVLEATDLIGLVSVSGGAGVLIGWHVPRSKVMQS